MLFDTFSHRPMKQNIVVSAKSSDLIRYLVRLSELVEIVAYSRYNFSIAGLCLAASQGYACGRRTG